MSDQETPVIKTEEDYQEIRSVLTKKKRPPKVLRIMMNALEAYRQSRKYGWSRPWNKYDLLNFQSFILDWRKDSILLDYARDLIARELTEMPDDARAFCAELIAGRDQLMGFIFIHEYSEGGDKYEGATLSLGRINGKRYRDRLDIILESPVDRKSSLGLERIRVYVDPYDKDRKQPLWSSNKSIIKSVPAQILFSALAEISWEWAGDPERMWDHWTSAYIDYFGERNPDMDASYFYMQGRPQARILIQTPNAEAGKNGLAEAV